MMLDFTIYDEANNNIGNIKRKYFSIGDKYEITIDDIGNDGEGIGHIYEEGSDKGIAVFVKDAVIGDVASVKLIKVKKNISLVISGMV